MFALTDVAVGAVALRVGRMPTASDLRPPVPVVATHGSIALSYAHYYFI